MESVTVGQLSHPPAVSVVTIIAALVTFPDSLID